MADFESYNTVLAGYQISLRPVTKHDLQQLQTWRNNPDISRFMISQSKINDEQQSAWFSKICRDNSQQHFIIEYKNQDIGSLNIKSKIIGKSLAETHIIEPGLYIADSRYRNNILAFSPTLLINDYCFETLRCEKLVATVKPNNKAALNYNLKLGYQIVKQGELIEIALNFEDYQKSTKLLKGLLSRSPKLATEEQRN